MLMITIIIIISIIIDSNILEAASKNISSDSVTRYKNSLPE